MPKSSRNHQSPALTIFVRRPEDAEGRTRALQIEFAEACAVRDARAAYKAEKSRTDEAGRPLRQV